MADSTKWRLFCPLMRELCVDGHTKSMGSDDDGHAIPCALWQERMVMDTSQTPPQVVPVRACYFHHATVLSINEIQATNHGVASTDEVRKELARIRGMAQQNMIEAELPPELPPGSMNGTPRLSR